MKRNVIVLILFTLFIGIGIGVGATILLQSNQVLYKNDKTVEEALNDLYTKSNIGDATASDIKAGKKALVGGQEVTGSLTIPSYTNLSGTQSVGAGSSSTLLNGYYNLSNYKVQCGSNSCSACNSCCPSCPSAAGAHGYIDTSSTAAYSINVGFNPSKIYIFLIGSTHHMYYDPTVDSTYTYKYWTSWEKSAYPYTACNHVNICQMGSTTTAYLEGGKKYIWMAFR